MVFRKQLYFLVPFSIFVVLGALLLIAFEKKELFLLFNAYYNGWGDRFFYYFTWLGDGWFAPVVILFLAFFKFRYAFMTFAAFGISTIVTQFLKRVIFEETLRPGVLFRDLPSVRFIPDIVLHSSFSFPSGHSSIGFCLFFCLSLFLAEDRKLLQLVFFTCALLVAYSRVYLAQHHFVDIYAGSIIGLVLTAAVCHLISRSENFKSKEWPERNLRQIIFK